MATEKKEPDFVRVLLHILLIALGGTALISGTMLVLHPDGSALDAPISLLEHTPFTDFLWPGAMLGVVFGMGGLLASLSIERKWRYAFRFAQVIGAGQVIWIAFQLHWFPETSALQPILVMAGLGIFASAEWCRRAPASDL